MLKDIRLLPVFIFIFINILFICKYSPIIGIHFLFIICSYVGVLLFFLKILERFKSQIRLHSLLTLKIITGMGCIFLMLTLFFVPPNIFPVDRCSAIMNFNSALLSGIFPYSESSHLNNPISGLPGLFIIALPFQLIGDVGLLQVFSFICFGGLVYYIVPKTEEGVFLLILLMTSPSFLWEVLARSEIFSNMILVLCVILYFEHNRPNKTGLRMILGGMLLGTIVSTRTIVLIPLCLYFVKYFEKNELLLGLICVITSIMTFSLTILPFAVWNWSDFINHNPLASQFDKSPAYISLPFVAISLFLSFLSKRFTRFIYSSCLLLFCLMFSIFFQKIIKFGWTATIYSHLFDISYFQAAIPFVLLSIFQINFRWPKPSD